LDLEGLVLLPNIYATSPLDTQRKISKTAKAEFTKKWFFANLAKQRSQKILFGIKTIR